MIIDEDKFAAKAFLDAPESHPPENRFWFRETKENGGELQSFSKILDVTYMGGCYHATLQTGYFYDKPAVVPIENLYEYRATWMQLCNYFAKKRNSKVKRLVICRNIGRR